MCIFFLTQNEFFMYHACILCTDDACFVMQYSFTKFKFSTLQMQGFIHASEMYILLLATCICLLWYCTEEHKIYIWVCKIYFIQKDKNYVYCSNFALWCIFGVNALYHKTSMWRWMEMLCSWGNIYHQSIMSLTDLPIKGTLSDVAGILSDTINRNTHKDSNTVTPRDIFSPVSGGK